METGESGGTIPADWAAVLAPVLQSPEVRQLQAWLRSEESAGKSVFPPAEERFSALALTPLDQVKVLILGQDPYHGPGQAHGLAFSVRDGMRLPPSLRNIYAELHSDLGVIPPRSGNLERWARQGVLLLNNTLTVEAGRAGSHARKGWEAFTDACVAAVASQERPCVFILWGNHAQTKAQRIAELGDAENQLVLTSVHPSPLSARRGFFGSRPFSQTNAFLQAHGIAPIDW